MHYGRRRRRVNNRVASGLTLGIALLACSAPETAAAPATHAAEPQRVWVTDGTIGAITATPQGVFAGGDFDLIGPETGTWAHVSGSGGVAPIRTPVEGTVDAAASDGRGGWYLAGQNFYVGGLARRGLIHLRSSGRLDKRWRPHVNGSVSALARVRSTLYVGGRFTKFGRKKRLRLAAIDVESGALKRWAPRVAPGKKDEEAYVSALAVARDRKTIYVGGSFGRLGRKRRADLGAVDAVSGSVRRWRPRVAGEVDALALDPRGRRIYTGGEFEKAGGLRRSGLAAFDLRKGDVTRWNPDCDGSVSQIVPAPSGSPVYVAGSFASIGQRSRPTPSTSAASSTASATWIARTWPRSTRGPVSRAPGAHRRSGLSACSSGSAAA